MIFLVIAYIGIGAFFGFLSAAGLQKLLHRGLKFHAEWTSTYVACSLTALTTAVVLGPAILVFHSDPLWLIKAAGTTSLVALAVGTCACRLVIRSRSGRHLSTALCAGVASALVAPPLVCCLAVNGILHS